MRLICGCQRAQLIRELKDIRVDQGSLPLFLTKAQSRIIRFDGLSSAQAAVLKQTALICGADAAIPRDVYRTRKHRACSVILFANQRELEKIIARLSEQAWLQPVAQQLMKLSPPSPVFLKIGKKRYPMNRTYIMGIINVTPDSFYAGSIHRQADEIEKTARRMEAAGADILDLGAESSRPGADPVTLTEEKRRLQSVLPRLSRCLRIPLSVDTYKAEIADWAIDHGAVIINDISGLRYDPRMALTVARQQASVVIMHMRGRPKTMQKNVIYINIMATLHEFFKERLSFAEKSGISADRIIIDPGLGFGKRLRDNYEIINRLSELTVFNRPLLVGHSRKSFIGKPFRLPPEKRLAGSLSVQALLIAHGASIIRVHDVLEAVHAARLIDRIQR